MAADRYENTRLRSVIHGKPKSLVGDYTAWNPTHVQGQ